MLSTAMTDFGTLERRNCLVCFVVVAVVAVVAVAVVVVIAVGHVLLVVPTCCWC